MDEKSLIYKISIKIMDEFFILPLSSYQKKNSPNFD
jgi:hypothetical protein